MIRECTFSLEAKKKRKSRDEEWVGRECTPGLEKRKSKKGKEEKEK